MRNLSRKKLFLTVIICNVFFFSSFLCHLQRSSGSEYNFNDFSNRFDWDAAGWYDGENYVKNRYLFGSDPALAQGLVYFDSDCLVFQKTAFSSTPKSDHDDVHYDIVSPDLRNINSVKAHEWQNMSWFTYEVNGAYLDKAIEVFVQAHLVVIEPDGAQKVYDGKKHKISTLSITTDTGYITDAEEKDVKNNWEKHTVDVLAMRNIQEIPIGSTITNIMFSFIFKQGTELADTFDKLPNGSFRSGSFGMIALDNIITSDIYATESQQSFQTSSFGSSNNVGLDTLTCNNCHIRFNKPEASIASLWSVSNAQIGQNSTLWAQVKNTGYPALPSDAKVWFYVSGPGYSGWAGSTSVANLATGERRWYYSDWSIPTNSQAGTYNYWAVVFTSGGSISSWSSPQTFAVTNNSSAQINSLWSVNAQCGQSSYLWANVKNTGYSVLPSDAKVWFYVSGPGYSGWVGSASAASLAANNSQWYYFDWSIPGGTQAGTYNYWAIVFTSDGSISSWSTAQNFTLNCQ